jgi:hypothetical protein
MGGAEAALICSLFFQEPIACRFVAPSSGLSRPCDFSAPQRQRGCSMKSELTATELRLRLERLDRHLSAAADKVLEGGAAMADQQRQIEVLRLKSSLLRQRLQEAKATSWEDVKASLQADWDALSEALEHWMKSLDKDFRERPYGQ